MITPNQPLKEVLLRIEQATSLPIVVFDLDDTLFSTARRNLILIQNFAVDNAIAYPRFAEVAEKLTLKEMNWSVKSALVKAGLDSDDPSIPAFVDYWAPNFFSNDYVFLDLPNSGAVSFVNKCHEAGALIYYLTGRGVGDKHTLSGMGEGTVLSLTNRGFPYWRGRCELNLKADGAQKDAEYKLAAVQDIRSLKGTVVATFDNEPANCVVFKNHFPNALNFWLKTTWNPEDKADVSDFITLENFIN